MFWLTNSPLVVTDVIIQPPVLTDFKTLVSQSGRAVRRNPLVCEAGRYEMDLEDLEDRVVEASDSANSLLILCNPRNPVGREPCAEVQGLSFGRALRCR